MKVVLLHGPAVNNSRTKLNSLKQEFDVNNVVVFDEGSKIDEIVGSLMTQSIFDEERLFILENPPEDFTFNPLYPKSESSQAPLIPYTLVLWFDHEVSEKKPILEWVRKNKGEILFFPEAREVSVFPFLDYLANEQSSRVERTKGAFLEIKKLKSGGFDIFYLITMTFYLLRNLVATPKNAPQFVRQKLEKQRKNFSLEKLINLYQEVLDLDFKLKSGLLDQSQAEFSLVNQFLKN